MNNFERLELRKLVAIGFSPTWTQPSLFEEASGEPGVKAVVRCVPRELTGAGYDFERLMRLEGNSFEHLNGDGSFASNESLAELSDVDVVVTNPPFSIITDLCHELFIRNKAFIILGPLVAVAYREILEYQKVARLYISNSNKVSLNMSFRRPDKENKVLSVRWFVFGDTFPERELFPCTEHCESKNYEKYLGTDIIDVPSRRRIPCDYKGIMGVPITYLDIHNPAQFEILGIGSNLWLKSGDEAKTPFGRVLIKFLN